MGNFGCGAESETISITSKTGKDGWFKHSTARFVTKEGYKNPDFSVRVPGESGKESSKQTVETAAGDEYKMKVWKVDEERKLFMEGEGIRFVRYINDEGQMVLVL